MIHLLESSCCVCGLGDARALVGVALKGGGTATVCGTHALMHRRSAADAVSVPELRDALRDRRDTGNRREETGSADELGMALSAAFGHDRRVDDRRRAV